MVTSSSLSPSAQTAYAQLLDAALAADHQRSVATLPGSFAHKTVKGRRYWYYQFTEISGKLRQAYVGPDSEAVRGLIAQATAAPTAEAIERLARSAIALGNAPVLAPHFRIVRRLGDYGFFRAGGVLIGTHAFLAYGNMLGVHWADATRTQDVDFAHAGKQLALALPGNVDVDTHSAVDSLRMGFLPAVTIEGARAGSYLNPRDPDFQLDFLTPLHRAGAKPYEHPALKVVLQPLPFIEYLLEDVQQAVLFCNQGAVVCPVPHPARYALHKLIVAGERSASRAAKARKDLQQAAAVLAHYRAGSTLDVRDAWADLVARGSAWSSRVLRGRDALAKIAPELELPRLLAAPMAKPRARP
jgi:hypothetical protein